MRIKRADRRPHSRGHPGAAADGGVQRPRQHCRPQGDHILAMADGHRFGVDHGLTCHSEHKLRTVLWGWIGEALSAEELAGIDRVHEGLGG